MNRIFVIEYYAEVSNKFVVLSLTLQFGSLLKILRFLC